MKLVRFITNEVVDDGLAIENQKAPFLDNIPPLQISQ